MSAAPKRLHEESASNEYHPSAFEPGQDGRLSKMPRTDPRDIDRRSPLHQMYRGVPQAGNDSFFEHPNTSEVRIDPKVDNRDSKLDADSQNLKGRGDASKDVKHDRDPHMDFRADSKTEKDAYYAANSHLNWKESREQHRGKRFPESANNGIDAWRTSRSTIQGTSEIARDSPIVEERGFSETHEAVGENKIDFRSDDKFRDKDRKKKDEKYKDWGERDKDRNDRRSNLQLGISSSEHREITREEREPERWERERKDTQKERERSKEREKKETVNGVEKEGSHIEKDSGEEPARMSVQENPSLEPKRQKDLDSWKASDKDSKDRRKEKDVELEGDKQENQSRCYDKESDDGFMEGEGGTERERESFSSGVQQRRRMLRPRGSPQMASREARFRSRSRDYEEAQEKAEVSTVVYKVGECMQELIKLWKEFEASQDNKNDESSLSGPTLEIQIAAEYVTATNRQVRGGQLWGTDIYTDDSDLVAVLMHTGYCRPTASPPPSAIKELCATIRVLPPQDSYTSTLRNNVRSRAWGAAIGCSYRVERCCIVKNGGGTIDLKPCLTHTSSVEPTLAPVTVERTMTTRAAASNALRQQRFVREVTIQYNLCNEPWIKYSISIVADKGLKKPLYTSARLKNGEVLYLETHTHRYELCFIGERTVSSITACQPSEVETDKSQTHNAHDQNGERSMADRETLVDVFRWSRCKKPLPQNIMRSIGIPLPPEHIEVLADNIDWEDVQWSQTGVWIAGKEYPLARVHFLSPN